MSAGRRRRESQRTNRRIAAYVERVLADAPPLDADQKARLALLLHGGAAA